MTSMPGLDDAGIAAVSRRVDFLEQLRDGPMAVRDVVDEMDHSRSTVNRALSELESHGLVEQQDGGYVTTLTGALAAREHRLYLERMRDLLGADAVLAPLAATSSIDRQAVVGARTDIVEGPNPVGSLEPVYEAVSTGERLRILLPSLPSREFLERLETALVDRQVEAQILLGTALLESLDGRAARSVHDLMQFDQCQIRIGTVPSYSVVLSESGDSTRLVVMTFQRGSVHGVLSNDREDAVTWGTEAFQSHWETSDSATSEQAEQLDRAGSDESVTAHRETPLRSADTLPFGLRVEGWTAVDDSLFADRSPVDPAVGWRAGLGFAEIRAGYAVERERPTDGGRRSLNGSIVADLADGDDVVVLGSPGSGKSTLCKSVAYEWYESDRGPVFYRESGSGTPFDTPVLLEEILREATGHALVVVEDVMRAEAAAVLDVAESLRDRPDVSFLFDSRETEWTDAENQPLEARVEAYRSREVTVVTLPPLDDRERDRFVEQFQRLADVPLDDSAFDPVSSELEAAEGTVGEVLLLSHRLSSLADPALGAESVPSSLDEEIRRVVASLREADSDVALDVAILTNVLNGSGVGVYPELLFALVDVASASAVRDAIETLEGQLLFAGGESRAPTDRYRSVHGFWSYLFLRHVAETLADREAQERFGRCVTALLSVAEDDSLREEIAWEFEGTTPYLDSVIEEPTGWVDRTVEQVFAFGRNNPGLTSLYGKTGYSHVDLPELTSSETRLQATELRGGMARRAGLFDRAEHEYTLLVDTADADSPSEREFEIRGLKNLAYVARNRGNYETATEYAEQGLSLAEQRSCENGIAGCLNELGAIQYQMGRYQAAISYYRRSLELRRRLNDTLGEASTAANLGSAKMLLGEFDAAEELFEESLSLREAIGDRWGAGITLDNLGVLEQARGQFQQAANAHSNALNLANEVQSAQLAVHASAHLSDALTLQGAFEDATRHLDECDRLVTEGDFRQFEAYKLVSRAKLVLYRGEYERAVDIATRAKDTGTEMDNPSAASMAREVIARGYRRRRSPEEAEAAASKNVERRRDLEERDNVAESMVTLAEVRIDQREYEEAADLLAEALDIARETGAGFFEARARRAQGRLAVAEDRPEDAREHLEAAVAQFRDGSALPDAAVSAATLVAVCESLGDGEAAERWRATRENLLAETDLDEAWLRHRTALPGAN
jgi:tetratricopeptide (TPR) repeat protein/DNA-binding transcriptional ArsR family regulator/energy-coupling factor transporter ATP-binding protein EcfA2